MNGNRNALYFWSNIVTPHWLGTLRLIGKCLGAQVVVYADELDQPESRRQLGWSEDLNATAGIDLSLKPKLDRANLEKWRGGHHLICNPFNNAYHRKLIGFFDRCGISYGFQQSPPGLFSSALGKMARSIVYRSLFKQSMLKAQYVLCHGSKCRSLLAGYGIPVNKLFASGYFIDFDAKAAGIGPPRLPGRPMNAVYLGQFVEGKQVVPFAAALAPIMDRSSLRMDYIGSGVLQPKLAEIWKDRPGQVMGPIAYKDVIRCLSGYDVLVLPSRADEWAMVVNEAIHAGCAVILTGHCGAADLVASGKCGIVAKDAADCARELARLSREPDRCHAFKQASWRLSPAITSQRGAEYIAQIILNGPQLSAQDHLPPWVGGPEAVPPAPGQIHADKRKVSCNEE